MHLLLRETPLWLGGHSREKWQKQNMIMSFQFAGKVPCWAVRVGCGGWGRGILILRSWHGIISLGSSLCLLCTILYDFPEAVVKISDFSPTSRLKAEMPTGEAGKKQRWMRWMRQRVVTWGAHAFPLQLGNGRRQWNQVVPKLVIFSNESEYFSETADCLNDSLF